ncbi:MAG: Gfo/Idh/MocA family oxidoreductase [Ignavibacteriaceae bacterium]
MKRKIKLGIIGTGIAARKLHLPALQKLKEEFEIAAVCNHTEAKAAEFSKIAGDVPYFLNYKKLLKDKTIEAVDIVLPISLNYKVVKDALKAGKHVIVEKPIAVNLKEAKKMLSFNKKYKTAMMVAENYRYRKSYRKAKEIIESGAIGKPYGAQWNVFYYNTEDNEYGATKWRQKNLHPGGFITDGGVHNTAALRDLFGEVKYVSAVTDGINTAIGTHDTLFGYMVFNSGVKVNINLLHSSAGHNENRLLIFCKDGTIEINDNVMQVKKTDASVHSEDFGDDSGFYEEFLVFHSAVTGGKNVNSSFEEAYKDLELIMAMLESADKNKIIKIG